MTRPASLCRTCPGSPRSCPSILSSGARAGPAEAHSSVGVGWRGSGAAAGAPAGARKGGS